MDQTALYKGLDDNPGDTVALKALADFFEENGDTTSADCLRWLAEEGKVPYRYSHENELRYHHDSWREGWWWWTTKREKDPWGYPPECTLPHAFWKKLSHAFPYDPCVFREYPTVRAAIEAVLEAWRKPGRKPRVRRSRVKPGVVKGDGAED